MLHKFDDANFKKEVLSSKTPVLVDFWASWCGPCRKMGPVVEALAAELAKEPFKVGQLNVDENPTTASVYGIMSLPTFMVFSGGQPIAQLVGTQPKARLLQALQGKED